MKLFFKIVSIATAVLFVYLFTQLFFISDSFVRGLGLEPSVASLVLSRRASIFMLGIAILLFASRNLPPSKTRQIICFSIGLTLFGLACMGSYEFVKGNVNSSIMIAITTETILWVSYGIIILKDRNSKII
jgi:hypothetical protein